MYFDLARYGKRRERRSTTVQCIRGGNNTAATWSASAGTIESSGLYVAPTSVGTYVVTSTSAADPTKSAAASITVAAAQSVSVSISPATVAMPEKWQQQFAATVSGSTNTAVTWTISQGNGSITQSGSSLHLRVLKSMW